MQQYPQLSSAPAPQSTAIASTVLQQPEPAPAPPPSLPTRKVHKWPAIIVFCLFAALIPETIATSSSSVLALIVSPINVLFLSIFYGTADLLIREAIIRRKVGVASMLLFGCAFGFVNEGVVAGTWYTVRPTGYLFLAGIDWAWIVSLTIFHIFISVMVPIAFFDLLFPSLAGQSLLRRRGIIICTVLFLGLSSLVVFAPNFRAQRFVVLGIAILLAFLALRLSALPRSAAPSPPAASSSPAEPAPRLWSLRILGFLAMFSYFVLIYLLPALTLPLAKALNTHVFESQVIDAEVLVVFAAYLVTQGHAWRQQIGWSPRHTLALLTGATVFFALVSLIPQQIAILEPLATLPFLLLLIWLHRRRASTTITHGT